MMAQYLIAGAAGYVGSRLARRLRAQGHRVRGLVRTLDDDEAQALAADGVVVWAGDVTRPETLVGIAEGVEYIYNVTGPSILEHDCWRATYIAGNHNLIAACSRSRSVRAYVFTSNVSPYGDAGDTLVTEDTPIAPCCEPGRVIAEAEQLIMEQVRCHNFPAMILRVGTIYGPGRDFTEAVQNHTLPIFGTGNNYVPRIHIDDLLTILEHIVVEGNPAQSTTLPMTNRPA
ncbi:MAG: NAD-dependent epimerase/dehydratase family protein [Blastochloris sp.]|nr:NAD-dependent epimerase/dehydratase family protein [Blastochloris sp.]